MKNVSGVDPLLALRGIACLIIIWYHTRAPVGWLILSNQNLSFLTAPSGLLAVYVFYLISGYSVGYGFFSKKYSLTLPSLKTFYVNRLLRIAPAYYVCVLLSIFLFYPQVHVTLFDVIRFFTFTMNIGYPNLPFQLLLVIISTEMQFYLVAPFLYKVLAWALGKVRPIVILCAILLIGPGVRYALYRAGLVGDMNAFTAHVYITVWGMLDYFLFGMLLSFLVIERKQLILKVKKYIPNVIYIPIVICWFVWVSYGNFEFAPAAQRVIFNLFILPPTVCLIVGWFMLISSAGRSFKANGVSVFGVMKLLSHPRTFIYGVGYISYGLYLYHFIYYDLLFFKPAVMGDTWPLFAVNLLTIFVLAMGTALVSYAFVEHPFLKLKLKHATLVS